MSPAAKFSDGREVGSGNKYVGILYIGLPAKQPATRYVDDFAGATQEGMILAKR
jgi:hypothetical protein